MSFEQLRTLDEAKRKYEEEQRQLEAYWRLLEQVRLSVESKEQNFAQAVRQAEQAQQLYPGIPDAYFYRGVALARSESYAPALLEFERAIALNGKNPDYHQHKGIVLELLGRIADAKEAYKAAKKFRPDDELTNELLQKLE